MVNLTRIYTKTGDGGKTRLGDNSEVAKTDLRVEAFGAVDELNAAIGLARADGDVEPFEAVLARVQNDLFDLGGDLCRPEAVGEKPGDVLRLQPDQVEFLEAEIDRLIADLEPLRSFVLPAGSRVAAHLHVARSICWRAERNVWSLRDRDSINEQVTTYLNRLSDLLFVMARVANDGGRSDVLWEPAQSQTSDRGSKRNGGAG